MSAHGMDRARGASLSEIKQLGREDGEWLFSIYQELIKRQVGAPERIRDEFEKWAADEIAKCEVRMRSIGCSPREIKAWRRGCGKELLKREKALLENVRAQPCQP